MKDLPRAGNANAVSFRTGRGRIRTHGFLFASFRPFVASHQMFGARHSVTDYSRLQRNTPEYY